MTGISKSYGAVRAIKNADLTVKAGTVHAIIGENGAGKSTLIKIIAGAESSDTGTVEFDGESVAVESTNSAIALGIQTVYQEPQLFPELTVAENIFMGREIKIAGRINWVAQMTRVAELLALLRLPAHYAATPIAELSIAEQQQVSIAKALVGEAKVLILDEPSAILTDSEIDVLFTVIRNLAAEGVSIIYISHRLDELAKIADEVTVMRDGQTIESGVIADYSVRQMAELMVGGILNDSRLKRDIPAGDPKLVVSGLARGGRFHDVNLAIRSGEIVGLYGLVGSGAAEIAKTLYGIESPTSGTMRLDGRLIQPKSPADAQRLGIALLPANRKVEGMFSFQSIAFNISAGNLGHFTKAKILMQPKAEKAAALDLIKRLAVKTPGEAMPIGSMSGGNAQKVVLARLLVNRPEVLVLTEPTQGVDVGAKEEIHRIITTLAEQGTAVLVVTSDLAEVLRLADRTIVVRAGTTSVEFGPEASQVDLLSAAAGQTEELIEKGGKQ
ncbi:sugar ABC transporter ATP-binding protein [Arthrobacter psychrolactophilus]